MNPRAKELIRILELSAHPEGGFYREVYRSPDQVYSPKNHQLRNGVTDIYFLLTSGQVSRFHRVIHDELWHFYEGDPLALIDIEPNTLAVTQHLLGCNSLSLNSILNYKHCVPGNHWQAAYSTGEYSLVGCTVAPGFDFADFEFLREDQTVQTKIINAHPEFSRFL